MDIRSLAARADKLWAIYKQHFHDPVANVDMAEEQPATQIAAIQKKEPIQKKKLPWKKTGEQPLARRHLVLVLDMVALLILSRLGLAPESVSTIVLTEPGPARVWPPAGGRETSVLGVA